MKIFHVFTARELARSILSREIHRRSYEARAALYLVAVAGIFAISLLRARCTRTPPERSAAEGLRVIRGPTFPRLSNSNAGRQLKRENSFPSTGTFFTAGTDSRRAGPACVSRAQSLTRTVSSIRYRVHNEFEVGIDLWRPYFLDHDSDLQNWLLLKKNTLASTFKATIRFIDTSFARKPSFLPPSNHLPSLQPR